MSFTPYDVCTWARRQRVGQSSRKMILILLAEYADRFTWECHPSIELLADNAEVDVRTVGRALKKLEDDGFIGRERLRRKDGSYCGWRFVINPSRTDIVVPGTPPSDKFSDALLDEDGNYPSDILSDGAAGDPQDVVGAGESDHNSHRTSEPPGAKSTVVFDASHTDAESGPKEQLIGTTNTPLTPQAAPGDAGAAARQPDGPAAPPPGSAGSEDTAAPWVAGKVEDASTFDEAAAPVPDSAAIADGPAAHLGEPAALAGEPAAHSGEPAALARLKAALRARFGDAKFRSWFEDLECAIAAPPGGVDEITLSAPGQHKADIVEQRFGADIRRTWAAVNGGGATTGAAGDSPAPRIRIVARKPPPAAIYSVDQPTAAPGRSRRKRRGAA